MTTRYKVEVGKRVRELAIAATDLSDFWPPHLEHSPGECVDCDALRVLDSLAMVGQDERRKQGLDWQPNSLEYVQAIVARWGKDDG